MTETPATTHIAESIEELAFVDLIDAAGPSVRAQLGLDVVAVGRATALVCNAGGILLNRALAVTPSDHLIQSIVDLYRGRRIDSFFVHLYGDELATQQAARRAGLVRYPRAWLKVLRSTGPAPDIATSLTLDRARPRDALPAGALFARSFDLPDLFASVVPRLLEREGWEVFVARDNDSIAAVGLLFVRDGVAYLAGGATAQAYRRRGAQGALMALRVRRALELGCLWVATETGEPVEGDPQHSFRNMIRCGFEVVGRRDNYAPPDMAWHHGRRRAG